MESNIKKIREGLKLIADIVEEIDSKPKRKIDFRELSGDHITGGIITKFNSTGIRDNSSRSVLEVNDNGIRVRKAEIHELTVPTSINGNLTVLGNITSDKIEVFDTVKTKKLVADSVDIKELKSDIRVERSQSLEFIADANKISGKGLLWKADGPTKQFVFLAPGQFFSTEDINLHRDKNYSINNVSVLSETTLGLTVKNSSLETLGKVKNLQTEGSLIIDDYFYYNENKKIGIGTSSPSATLHISNEHGDFKINGASGGYEIGTANPNALNLMTDGTPRLQIDGLGQITLNKKVFINGQLGIGVKNTDPTVDISTANAVSFQNKRFEVLDNYPSHGHYKKGDIVWNSNTISGSYIGWVCTREGSPGIWKAFGQILH